MTPGRLIVAVVLRGVSLLVRYIKGRKYPCGKIGCPHWTATEHDHCREYTPFTIARCADYREWNPRGGK